MGDILRFNSDHINVAFAYDGAPDHYIHFQYPQGVDVSRLEILVQHSGVGWKSLGPLTYMVKLPQIIFPPHAKLVVQGFVNGQSSSYSGHLVRGAMYQVNAAPGHYPLPAWLSTSGAHGCGYNSPQ